MSAIGNARDLGNDRVVGAHLMNMQHHETRGLSQETVYGFYSEDIQRRQVSYTGLKLANVLKQRNLGEAEVTITEDWSDVDKPMRKRDRTFSRQETVKLRILHNADKMGAILNFWHGYHKNNECKWLKQPALHYEGAIAWIMPTPHPAIIYRPGEFNRAACMQFINYHTYLIDSGQATPQDWSFPEIPI